MEYPSIKMLMEQIRDWAEEEDYDAIIEVLPELKTPGQFYEAVLCLAYAYLNQGFYRDAEEWLRKVESQGCKSGVWNYRLAVALMHQMRLEEALPYAERAVTVEADYPWGWLVYSKLLYGGQRTEEALEAAKKGLALMHDGELVSGNRNRQVFEVVFACALNKDSSIVLGRCALHRREVEEAFSGSRPSIKDVAPVLERPAREGVGLCGDFIGRALKDDVAALLPAVRTELDDPVCGIENVEVVFDHKYGMSEADEAVEHAYERGGIVKVQAGRWFVKDE